MTDRDTTTRTRARAPGVGGVFHRMAVQYIASNDPTLCGSMLKHEGRRQTDRRSAYAGSRLKLIDASGRSRLIRQPFSRNGENSPYGMLGGIVETSASFEARSAPRSYPTGCPNGRGRDGCCQPPPAQIPACAANAPGSSLGFWRRSGDMAVG